MATLELRNLTKIFGDLTAVDNISLSVEENDFIGLLGPNGAGKTTLLSLITGDLSPSEGEIHFRGEDISKLPPNKRCQKGIVKSYQIPSVFPGLTVRENVHLSVQRTQNKRLSMLKDHKSFEDDFIEIDEILTRVGLTEEADTTAESLSHGGVRRLDIAITLATNSEVLLFDEPLAGLSESEEMEIMDLISQLSNQFTIIFVEHNVDMVLNNAERIIILHQGQIICDGDDESIISNPDVQNAYLGREFA